MKMLNDGLRATLAVAAFAISLPAHAHITFENKEVTAGSTVKFVLRVPHGCADSSTIAVRIAIPAELSEVGPQQKEGWTIAVLRDGSDATASIEAASDMQSGEAGAPIKEISWSGGKIKDAHYEKFAFNAKIDAAATGRDLFIPIVQQCESGVHRWIEVPGAGGSSDKLESPAPSVKVLR